MRRAATLLSWLLGLAACHSSYAPAIRGMHAGVPGRLSAGQLEVGGTAGGLAAPLVSEPGVTTGGLTAPLVGGPHFAFGLSDLLALEVGANLGGYGPRWATGWGGVRLTRQLPLGHRLRLVGDFELGAGAGVGGMVNGDSNNWDQLRAFGVYEGLGLGLDWRGLGVYFRARLDASAGDRTPTTFWPSALLGLEVRPIRWGALGLGIGHGAWWNRSDGLVNFWFYQVQLTLTFDLLQRPAG